MNSTKFIDGLVADLKPVKPLLPIKVRTLVWFIIQTVIVSGVLFALAPWRPGFLEDLQRPRFALEIVLWLLSIVWLGGLGLQSVIPGAEKKWMRSVSFIPLILLVGGLCLSLVSPARAPTMLGKRPLCFLEVIIYSLIPLTHFAYLLRKGFIVKYGRSIVLMGLSCSLIPAALMHVACMYNPMHVILFHLLPAFATTGLVYLVLSHSRIRKNIFKLPL